MHTIQTFNIGLSLKTERQWLHKNLHIDE